MIYSPYDYEVRPLGKEINKEIFDSKILVKNGLEEKQKEILRYLYIPSGDTKRTILLTGHSGTGKTTFLNWFIEKLNRMNDSQLKEYGLHDKLYPVYLNPINKATPNKSKICFYIVKDKLVAFLEDPSLRTIEYILEEKEIFGPIFDNIIGDLEFLRRERQKVNINKEVITNFMQILSRHPNLSFLLFHLFHIEKAKGRKLLLIYDNLDEMVYDPVAFCVFDEIENIKNVINRISEEKSRFFNISPSDDIRRILVFRESTISKSNAPIGDRTDTYKETIRLNNDISKILEKRINYGIDKSIKNKSKIDKNFSFLLSLNKEHKPFFKNILNPLFNYDIRNFIKALMHICGKYIDQSQFYFNNSQYQALYSYRKENRSNKKAEDLIKFGLRGIYYNLFLRYLKGEGLLNSFHQESIVHLRKHCNFKRIFLTALYNLSYPEKVVERDIHEYHSIEPEPVSLPRLFNELKKAIPVKELISALRHFYKPETDGSWAHLITIYNLEMNNDELIRMEDLLEKHRKGFANPFDRKELEEVKITLNPSGFIYLRRIITHFEYFSIVLNPKNKPLCFATEIVHLDKNNSLEKIYEFELILEEVFEKVKGAKERMSIFLEEDLVNSGVFDSKKEYSNSTWCFATREKQPFLYSTRIINNHISYLDFFRHFTWYCESFQTRVKGYQKEFKNNTPPKKLIEIQEVILKKIKSYNNLLSDEVKLKSIYDNNNALYEKLIEQIKNGSYGETWGYFGSDEGRYL